MSTNKNQVVPALSKAGEAVSGAWNKVRSNRWIAVGSVGVIALLVGGFFALRHGSGLFDALRYRLAVHPSVQQLQQELARNPKDVKARTNLAHAYFEAGNRGLAMVEYERALKQEPRLSSSTMTADLLASFGTAQQPTAGNLIASYKMLDATEGLERLTADGRYAVRTGALATLERTGRASHGDYLRVWTADLSAPDCEVKRHAIAKLGELGDHRALAPIQQARAKDDKETPWYKFRCIGNRSEEAQAKILAHDTQGLAKR